MSVDGLEDVVITDEGIKRMEETFWRGIRIRYEKRREKTKLGWDENDYDIETLLNTVQILKSEIDDLKKKVNAL